MNATTADRTLAVERTDSADSSSAPLDPGLCYRAVAARDPRFDGRFFVCVSSTGVYCRPVCPARIPKRRHCTFVPSAAAAEAAGFRSCLRCRPEAAPGAPPWIGTAATVSRALRLIEGGALDGGRVEDLAARLGVGERQLRRLFMAHVGAGPQAVAANRRLLTAKQLISDTRLPLGNVAFAAGFRSLRRFNDAIRAAYGVAPSALRRASGAPRGRELPGGAIRIRLGYRPPFDFDRMLAYLHSRMLAGVERVESGRYVRGFALGRVKGVISVAPAASGHALEARVTPIGTAGGAVVPVRAVVARLRRLFDLDAEPGAIAACLAADPLIGARLSAAPLLRVPGAFDPFELAVRAVLGQQISVKGAATLASRLVANAGEPIDTQVEGVTHLFPTPEALAAADLSGTGIMSARRVTLRALAHAVASGAVDLTSCASLEAKIAELTAVPGIGEWTAHYVALRALGEPDAFPASDLGLRKAAGNGVPLATKSLAAAAERWRPWRGYAAVALWSQ